MPYTESGGSSRVRAPNDIARCFAPLDRRLVSTSKPSLNVPRTLAARSTKMLRRLRVSPVLALTRRSATEGSSAGSMLVAKRRRRGPTRLRRIFRPSRSALAESRRGSDVTPSRRPANRTCLTGRRSGEFRAPCASFDERKSPVFGPGCTNRECSPLGFCRIAERTSGACATVRAAAARRES